MHLNILSAAKMLPLVAINEACGYCINNYLIKESIAGGIPVVRVASMTYPLFNLNSRCVNLDYEGIPGNTQQNIYITRKLHKFAGETKLQTFSLDNHLRLVWIGFPLALRLILR